MKWLKKFLSTAIIVLFSLTVLMPCNARAKSKNLNENQQMIDKQVYEVSSKISDKIITAKNDTIYQDSDDNITSGMAIIYPEKNLKSAATGIEIGRINWHISNEYVNGKSQFTYHIDNIIGVSPTLVDVSLEILTRDGLGDSPQTYGTANLTFNADEITPGVSKSLSVNPRTGYLTVRGKYGISAPGAISKYYLIGDSTILTNKLNEYFPNYVDPVSKKQAITGVRTDWALTGSHQWNGRTAYMKEF